MSEMHVGPPIPDSLCDMQPAGIRLPQIFKQNSPGAAQSSNSTTSHGQSKTKKKQEK